MILRLSEAARFGALAAHCGHAAVAVACGVEQAETIEILRVESD